MIIKTLNFTQSTIYIYIYISHLFITLNMFLLTFNFQLKAFRLTVIFFYLGTYLNIICKILDIKFYFILNFAQKYFIEKMNYHLTI